ncbi:MAG TPA: MAPEG family protein [Myxococcota bacterium]|nr:MAPEG family protein [Myxococcota bacterium]
MLALSTGLGFVHIVAASHSASLQRGYRWAASARDEPVDPLRGVAGRLDRASRNFFETFPLFAAAVLAGHAIGRHNALTEWGARLYFWGRVCYLPLYAAGIPLVRSLVWNVASVGILLCLAALFWS